MTHVYLGPILMRFSYGTDFILKVPYPFEGRFEGFDPTEITTKGLH